MNKTFFLILVLALSFFACIDNQPVDESNIDDTLSAIDDLTKDTTAVANVNLTSPDKTTTKISPYMDLSKIDDLLKGGAEKRQIYSALSDKPSKVIGNKGTIIYVDPTQLETVDGSPMGKNIKVELIEYTNKYDMLTSNLQTSSDGEILITGGAYYINMTSNGKKLKIKNGKAIKVEFPKLSNDEMALFVGERDKYGQVNWKPTQRKFISKKKKNVQEPNDTDKTIIKRVIRKKVVVRNTRIVVQDGRVLYDTTETRPKEINKEDVSEAEYKDYLKSQEAYKKKQKEIEIKEKTYQAIRILNFGLINCDRFYRSSKPKTTIRLAIANDSITSARFYAVFHTINSVLAINYWGRKGWKPPFRKIPVGMKMKIIGLSVKDDKPLWFSTDITSAPNQEIDVVFTETTQMQIQDRLVQYKK